MSELISNIVTPLYQQLYDIIKDQLKQGIYKSGDKIPSEDELSKIYGISRVTVRSALAKLVENKVLVKIRGKGTFVATPVFIESYSAQGSFTKSCLQMNATPSTKLIGRSIIKAGNTISKLFGIAIGDKVICIKRVRLINDTPAIFEVDYFTADNEYMMSVDVEHTPLRDIVKCNRGLIGKSYLDTFEVKFATKEQAECLHCPAYSALLGVSQVVYTDKRNIVYYNEQFIRSDIYKYVMCG